MRFRTAHLRPHGWRPPLGPPHPELVRPHDGFSPGSRWDTPASSRRPTQTATSCRNATERRQGRLTGFWIGPEAESEAPIARRYATRAAGALHER